MRSDSRAFWWRNPARTQLSRAILIRLADIQTTALGVAELLRSLTSTHEPPTFTHPTLRFGPQTTTIKPHSGRPNLAARSDPSFQDTGLGFRR
jgi:hypothetical protein